MKWSVSWWLERKSLGIGRVARLMVMHEEVFWDMYTFIYRPHPRSQYQSLQDGISWAFLLVSPWCAGSRVSSGGAVQSEGSGWVLCAGGRPPQPRAAVSRGGSVTLRERSFHVQVSHRVRPRSVCGTRRTHSQLLKKPRGRILKSRRSCVTDVVVWSWMSWDFGPKEKLIFNVCKVEDGSLRDNIMYCKQSVLQKGQYWVENTLVTEDVTVNYTHTHIYMCVVTTWICDIMITRCVYCVLSTTSNLVDYKTGDERFGY